MLTLFICCVEKWNQELCLPLIVLSFTPLLLPQASWRSGRWCCMAPLCTRISFAAKSLALQKSWRTPTRSSQRSTTVGDKSSHREPQPHPLLAEASILTTAGKIPWNLQLCRSRPLRSRVQRAGLRRSRTPPMHQLPPLLPQVQEQHQVRGWSPIGVEEKVFALVLQYIKRVQYFSCG